MKEIFANEIDVYVSRVRWPMRAEIFEEMVPVRNPVPAKVTDGERETVIDASHKPDILAGLVDQPVGNLLSIPVPEGIFRRRRGVDTAVVPTAQPGRGGRPVLDPADGSYGSPQLLCVFARRPADR